MKNLKNLGKLLSKNEQKAINGGVGTCPPGWNFPAQECIDCGGAPGNPGGIGCCLGTQATFLCLNGGL